MPDRTRSIQLDDPPVIKNTYSLDVHCTNCRYEGAAEIPKGTKLEDAECPTCGCGELILLADCDVKEDIVKRAESDIEEEIQREILSIATRQQSTREREEMQRRRLREMEERMRNTPYVVSNPVTPPHRNVTPNQPYWSTSAPIMHSNLMDESVPNPHESQAVSAVAQNTDVRIGQAVDPLQLERPQAILSSKHIDL